MQTDKCTGKLQQPIGRIILLSNLFSCVKLYIDTQHTCKKVCIELEDFRLACLYHFSPSQGQSLLEYAMVNFRLV